MLVSLQSDEGRRGEATPIFTQPFSPLDEFDIFPNMGWLVYHILFWCKGWPGSPLLMVGLQMWLSARHSLWVTPHVEVLITGKTKSTEYLA